MNASNLHQALLCPTSYPEDTGPVSFKETHISRLYFTQDHVYKVKKPVDFGFLDFTTLEKRRYFCQREVELNARFSPDTYLDVVEIRINGVAYQVGHGKAGEIVDYAVRMKRLPHNRMLATKLARAEQDLPEEMKRLGHHIAMLHLQAPPQRSGAGQPHSQRVQFNWDENLRQTAPFVGDTLLTEAQELMVAYVDDFFQRSTDLLQQREAAGYVIDGHGDLHTEHICLTDPIRIYDCIEFNDRFRIDDRVADLAFLLMDLEHRNRPDLARILTDAYLATIGVDPDFHRLLTFYKIYRAWVRGKVMSFLSRDTELSAAEAKQAREVARSYFNQALGYLCPQALILTCGLMGVGKSTLAQQLAQALRGTLLRSDDTRKRLQGIDPEERIRVPFGQGLYGPAVTKSTYAALWRQAGGQLEQGATVIIDASFSQRPYRERFKNLAEAQGLICRILWLRCPENVIRQRLRQRQSQGNDPSDGREELLEQQKLAFNLPRPGKDTLPIDSDQPVYAISRPSSAIWREPDREPSNPQKLRREHLATDGFMRYRRQIKDDISNHCGQDMR
ncbi:MAG: AAA family ATPase [Desulfuromonadaceae bacterium]